jgi:hypothetical protein
MRVRVIRTGEEFETGSGRGFHCSDWGISVVGRNLTQCAETRQYRSIVAAPLPNRLGLHDCQLTRSEFCSNSSSRVVHTPTPIHAVQHALLRSKTHVDECNAVDSPSSAAPHLPRYPTVTPSACGKGHPTTTSDHAGRPPLADRRKS